MLSATIASGQSLSNAVEFERTAYAMNGEGLIRVDMPAAWTTAELTLQLSEDGTTFRDAYDADGNEYVLAAAASRAILVPPADFAGVRYLKVRSGTGGSPVVQAGERTLILVTRPL